MSGGRIIHLAARDVDASWLGRRVTVTAPGFDTVTGGLSDVIQYPTQHRTLLYLAGRMVDVREDTTVTVDTLGLLGGGVR